MLFEVKFQVQIRQKCRSKWNNIGHTLELGLPIAIEMVATMSGQLVN